ncbi:MAG: nucleoside triphosphate pyrophosphohydrolase [bacterium]
MKSSLSPGSGDAIERLLDVVAALRQPETGCPWDLKQTHRSLIPFLVEEAYEVVDSIETGDSNHLCEELGDVLLQVALHARIAEEAGHFNFDDVAAGIAEKLVRRHPHVFADTTYANEAEQKAAWEAFKDQERRLKNELPRTESSALDGVAGSLPALMRAQRLQKRAARVGFDWPDSGPVFDKIEEEFLEVRQALDTQEGEERVAEEVGDLLFAVVNLSRHLGIDAEEALRKGNKKFETRFHGVEAKAATEGRSLNDAPLEQLESWWGQVKEDEKQAP